MKNKDKEQELRDAAISEMADIKAAEKYPYDVEKDHREFILEQQLNAAQYAIGYQHGVQSDAARSYHEKESDAVEFLNFIYANCTGYKTTNLNAPNNVLWHHIGSRKYLGTDDLYSIFNQQPPKQEGGKGE
jgi:hypothetical protein